VIKDKEYFIRKTKKTREKIRRKEGERIKTIQPLGR